MFHYDKGVKLTSIDLALDIRRKQPRGFISHAHADHLGRHELTYCTPQTTKLVEFRLGRRQFIETPYRQTLTAGDIRLTAYPAGHILGSAMLLADDGEHRLLFTGDFKLGDSATAAVAEVPEADILIMESTFGEPRYRLPSRESSIERLLQLTRDALEAGETPVIRAYVLGKAQEVTKILTQAGIPVLQHRAAYEISLIYQKCGCDLGDFSLYSAECLEGHAIVAPPQSQRGAYLEGLKNVVSIAPTGWAADRNAARRLGVDHAIPLSDHADYTELWELIERVNPRVIYCTHGPQSFVERLRKKGHNAYPLGCENRPQRDMRQTQLRLW